MQNTMVLAQPEGELGRIEEVSDEEEEDQIATSQQVHSSPGTAAQPCACGGCGAHKALFAFGHLDHSLRRSVLYSMRGTTLTGH